LANLGSSFHGKPWTWLKDQLVSDLPAKPCKAQSMTGPCRALLEEIIPWSKAQQGPVIDRALQGIASSETKTSHCRAAPIQNHDLQSRYYIPETTF